MLLQFNLLEFLLLFLFPIATYLMILASINRRDKPTLVTGFWDTMGLLLAASGALLAVGPAILTQFLWNALPAWPVDNQTPAEMWDAFWRQMWLWLGLYYGVVLLGGLAILLWRTRTTVIYNVDIDRFAGVFAETLDGLGLVAARTGRWLFITSAAPQTGGFAPDAARPTLAQVQIETFPAMCNVSMRWREKAQGSRRQIEDSLRKKLVTARVFDNPSANWLMAAGGVLFGLIFLGVLILFLNTYFPPRRW